MSKLLNVGEAIEYQKSNHGRVIYGRDALYALAHAKAVPVVNVGGRKIFFPTSSIDRILSGEHPTSKGVN
jgi:hypothetical protein